MMLRKNIILNFERENGDKGKNRNLYVFTVCPFQVAQNFVPHSWWAYICNYEPIFHVLIMCISNSSYGIRDDFQRVKIIEKITGHILKLNFSQVFTVYSTLWLGNFTNISFDSMELRTTALIFRIIHII